MIVHRERLRGFDWSETGRHKRWPSMNFWVYIFDTQEAMNQHASKYYGVEPDYPGQDVRALCLCSLGLNKQILVFNLEHLNTYVILHECFHACVNYVHCNRRRISKWHWVGLLLRAGNESIRKAEELLADLNGWLGAEACRVAYEHTQEKGEHL